MTYCRRGRPGRRPAGREQQLRRCTGPSGVEKLRQPVAISAVLHAATVAWLVTRAFPSAPVTTEVATTPIEIVAIAPAPEPVVTPAPAPDPQVAEPARVPEPAPVRPAAPRPAPSGERPEVAITVPAAAAPPAETAPAPTGLLRMRGAEPLRLGLPTGRWDDLDRPPAGTAPENDHATGLLRESGGGKHRYEHGGFGAVVNRDGSVTLRDKSAFHVRVAVPTPKSLGRALAGWYESDKGASGKEGDTAMAKQIQTSQGPSTDLPSAGKGEHELKDHAVTVIVPVFSGGFDPTDWLMRRKGLDPYASKKLRILDATRDERVQIGSRHRARQLAMTPQIVQRNLEALWAETTDPRARKQALFALWDECAETGDPAVIAGGEAARRFVIGFIRSRLPAGSADAFTPAEIAELARTQQSKTTFQPYE
jgi:hypothetical protein